MILQKHTFLARLNVAFNVNNNKLGVFILKFESGSFKIQALMLPLTSFA